MQFIGRRPFANFGIFPLNGMMVKKNNFLEKKYIPSFPTW